MYQAHQKVYPREVDGRFQRLRRIAVFVLLGLFYLFPPFYGALGRVYSPDLLLTGRTDAVVLLRDFKFYPPPTPTSGRDSNAILELVMGVPERPEDVARAFDEVRDLIDDERFAEARARLDALRDRVTEHDGEWLQLSTRAHVLERFDATDRQGP